MASSSGAAHSSGSTHAPAPVENSAEKVTEFEGVEILPPKCDASPHQLKRANALMVRHIPAWKARAETYKTTLEKVQLE